MIHILSCSCLFILKRFAQL